MQNHIRAEAWHRYKVEAKLKNKLTVMFNVIDNVKKRKEAIAASLGIDYEDTLTVWLFFNDMDMLDTYCELDYKDIFDEFFLDELKFDEVIKKIVNKYHNNHRIQALQGCGDLARGHIRACYQDDLTSLCYKWLEEVLKAYASDVDESYLQRCTEAFDMIFTTKLLAHIDPDQYLASLCQNGEIVC